MKKFHFKLAKIRKLREDRKKQAQREFAEAKLGENRERQTLDKLQQEAHLRRVQDKKTRIKRVVPSNLQRSHDYIKQIDFLIRHQTGRVALAVKETEECREKLESATREEKKYERLEEIKRDEYNREMNLLMQKETDEIASNVGKGRESPAAAS